MKGYTTIITTVLGMVVAAIAWLTGSMAGDTFYMSMYGGMMVIFARIGIDIKKGGWLSGYKTHLTAIGGMIGSLMGFLDGQLSLEKMITAIIMGLIGMRFRAGLKR